MCPGSATGKTDAKRTEAEAANEAVESQSSSIDKSVKQERTEEKDSEQDGTAEKDCEDKDEGLPPSNGSESEGEEGTEGQKEPSDANNNSIETQREGEDECIVVPEASAQVHT